jgi:hypothetical protein
MRTYHRPSKEQDASRAPSLLKFTEVTGSECADMERMHSPDRASHSLTDWSKEPDATICDRGCTSTQNT